MRQDLQSKLGDVIVWLMPAQPQAECDGARRETAHQRLHSQT